MFVGRFPLYTFWKRFTMLYVMAKTIRFIVQIVKLKKKRDWTNFVASQTIEFFRIEFYRIYRICRKLFLVMFIFKITKISILQNIQIL